MQAVYLGGDPREPWQGNKDRQGKEGSHEGGVTKQVTSMGNRGFIPLGISGRWCGTNASELSHQEQGSWGIYTSTVASHWFRAAPAGLGRDVINCH